MNVARCGRLLLALRRGGGARAQNAELVTMSGPVVLHVDLVDPENAGQTGLKILIALSSPKLILKREES